MFKEYRRISRNALRSLCIKQDWYTRGTNEQYSEILDYASSKSNLSTRNLVHIAQDIIAHSEMHQDYTIESVLYKLCAATYTVFVEVAG